MVVMVIVLVVEESNRGSKPDGVGVLVRIVVMVEGGPVVGGVVTEESNNGIKPAVEVVVTELVELVEEVEEVEEEIRNGVRPAVIVEVDGATVVVLERRNGSSPAVDGEVVVVDRSVSLKGKIPLGG